MPKHYKDDPFWTKAKFDGVAANGQPVTRGDRIFYYPLSKSVYTGDVAIAASEEFERYAMLEDAEQW